MNTACLRVDYASADEILGHTAAWRRSVLGVAGFSTPPDLELGQVPITASMTPLLRTTELGATERRATDRLCEVWRMTADPSLELAAGPPGGVSYRHGGGVLFGAMTIHEETGAAESAAGLWQTTLSAYQAIFEVLENTQHPHLIRVWNYLPEINREAAGEERYRHFNAARQAAFTQSGRSTVGTVPAASALGSPGGNPVSIYFLAARRPPTMIENPRQVSAYHYPPKFGAHSPTFSRACILRQAHGTTLFVSGTASIVGCETIHEHDVEAQTRESLANITALLDEANRVVGRHCYSLDGLRLKVYVRRASDLGVIGRVLAGAVRPVVPPIYLLADVCRRELLVEIEATGEAQQ
jgi:enamine deaminase RidA (YjgF/YER057c/UK114 family)